MTSIKKPQSAFQYYLKAWKDMPKELKVHFIELAKDDKERYRIIVSFYIYYMSIKYLPYYINIYLLKHD